MPVRQGCAHEGDEAYHDKIDIICVLPALDQAYEEAVVWLIRLYAA